MEFYAFFRQLGNSRFSAQRRTGAVQKKSDVFDRSQQLIAKSNFLKQKADELHRDGQALKKSCDDSRKQRERLRNRVAESQMSKARATAT
jgi:hypothetical protein